MQKHKGYKKMKILGIILVVLIIFGLISYIQSKKIEHDSTYILYHTFYPEKYPLENPLDYDLDGDGVITSDDAVILRRIEDNGWI